MPSKKHPLADDSNTASPSKTPKLEQTQIAQFQSADPDAAGSSNTNASGPRKKGSGAPSRTGQACDRCKNRKIRCDDTPGGCLPCRQNNSECKTTDRITHRATARGHTEVLERDVALLRLQVTELEHQLCEVGVEPKVLTPYSHARNMLGNDWTNTPVGQRSAWDPPGGIGGPAPSSSRRDATVDGDSSNVPLRAPSFMHGDKYLGISPANDLSNVRGTVLSLWGMEIDLAEFITDNPDDKIAALMTYEGIIGTIIAKDAFLNKVGRVELPKTYDECMRYVGYYFTVVDSVLPLLYRPAFEELLDKIYHRGYEPNTPEQVMVHMVIAFIEYQMAFRNDRNSAEHMHNLTKSLYRFHFCLSHYTRLISSQTTQDMQAAVLLCIYVRGFPKPGLAWTLINTTLANCIELGYHRSAKAFSEEAFPKDLLNIETRKRVFWTLLMCGVMLSGKLGRPMPMRSEDYDVEYLEPLNNGQVSAEPGSRHGEIYLPTQYCKMTELLSETYSTVYSVRPAQNYEASLRRLENKARKWKENLPPALSERESSDAEPSMSRIQALWLVCYECELQVLLHHPAVCRTTSPEVMGRNMEICMQYASTYIDTTVQLWTLKSLDTTWYNMTTFFSAIFTLLFTMWQRRGQITAADMQKLESDRDICLEVIFDIGGMMGSGKRLKDRMETIINTSIDRIRLAYNEKNASASALASASASASASAAVASAALSESINPAPSQVQDSSRDEKNYSAGIQEAYQHQKSDVQQGSDQPSSSTYPPPTDPALDQPQHPYSAIPTSHYPPPATSESIDSTPSYPYHVYAPESNEYSVNSIHAHGYSPMAANTYMFNSNASQGYQQHQHQQQQQPPYDAQIAWRQWLDNTRVNHDSASALMALGGRELNQGSSHHDHGQNMAYGGTIGGSGMPQLLPSAQSNIALVNQQWPMATFDPDCSRNYLVMADGSLRPKSG